jgi:hypothetical protein
MAHSLSFLLSSEAASARMIERKPAFVVHVETISDFSVADRFVELDADGIEHAGNIANAWVNSMGNASAAIRRVMPDGTLHKPCSII